MALAFLAGSFELFKELWGGPPCFIIPTFPHPTYICGGAGRANDTFGPEDRWATHIKFPLGNGGVSIQLHRG